MGENLALFLTSKGLRKSDLIQILKLFLSELLLPLLYAKCLSQEKIKEIKPKAAQK